MSASRWFRSIYHAPLHRHLFVAQTETRRAELGMKASRRLSRRPGGADLGVWVRGHAAGARRTLARADDEFALFHRGGAMPVCAKAGRLLGAARRDQASRCFSGQFLAQSWAIAKGVPVGLASVDRAEPGAVHGGVRRLAFGEIPTRMQIAGIGVARGRPADDLRHRRFRFQRRRPLPR